MFIYTVGELRNALAKLADDAPICIGAFGTRNTIKSVETHDGEAFVMPCGLGDLLVDQPPAAARAP